MSWFCLVSIVLSCYCRTTLPTGTNKVTLTLEPLTYSLLWYRGIMTSRRLSGLIQPLFGLRHSMTKSNTCACYRCPWWLTAASHCSRVLKTSCAKQGSPTPHKAADQLPHTLSPASFSPPSLCFALPLVHFYFIYPCCGASRASRSVSPPLSDHSPEGGQTW